MIGSGPACNIEQLRRDPRVEAVDADGDGLAVYLRAGFSIGRDVLADDAQHIFIEPTCCEAAAVLRTVKPCTCQHCRRKS